MLVTSKRAKEIIERILYITIASVSESGEPWNAPVYSAFDEDHNFYWGSHVDAQHSKNIRVNPNIFFVIYDSTIPAGEGEGVYIRARAEEMSDLEEIKKAHKLLWDRHAVPYWKLEEVHGDTPIRLYKAVPQKVWTNDEDERDGHYIDKRTEIEL